MRLACQPLDFLTQQLVLNSVDSVELPSDGYDSTDNLALLGGLRLKMRFALREERPEVLRRLAGQKQVSLASQTKFHASCVASHRFTMLTIISQERFCCKSPARPDMPRAHASMSVRATVRRRQVRRSKPIAGGDRVYSLFVFAIEPMGVSGPTGVAPSLLGKESEGIHAASALRIARVAVRKAIMASSSWTGVVEVIRKTIEMEERG